MLVNAYYFRQHMYTIVPRYVREDMEWMADVGTNALTIAVLEQDLYAAVENIEIVCNEAAKKNIKVFAVPSRWAGVVAGAPKVPSYFTVTHPETWILKEDGTPNYNKISGIASSIHHPATFEFFEENITRMLELWPISGIMWDEVKIFDRSDYSAAARKAMGDDISLDKHIDCGARFFDAVGSVIRRIRTQGVISMFLYADIAEEILERFARINNVDYFGCDGGPWPDNVSVDGTKNLLGAGLRFLDAARNQGKKTLMLVENAGMSLMHDDLMDRYYPRVLSLGLDQLIYYYYPRSLEDPDHNMAIVRKHLRSLL